MPVEKASRSESEPKSKSEKLQCRAGKVEEGQGPMDGSRSRPWFAGSQGFTRVHKGSQGFTSWPRVAVAEA